MKIIYFQRINCIHKLLLKRYSKGILFFLNIFFGALLLLLIFTLLNVIKTSTQDLSKQLIVFLLILFVIEDITNVFSIINIQTILSSSSLKIYPVSYWKRFKLVYYSFLNHSRSLIYILPAAYVSYILLRSLFSSAVLFVLGLAVFYLVTSFLISLSYFLLDYLKDKYRIKNIALFFLPVFLLPSLLGNFHGIFKNAFVDFLYNLLMKIAV